MSTSQRDRGSSGTPVISVGPIDPRSDQPAEASTATELYPEIREGTSTLGRALSLLTEADSILNEAERSTGEHEEMAADDAVQRFHALLPELFCCRSLGDGFATVVLSLFHGISNLKGLPAQKVR